MFYPLCFDTHANASSRISFLLILIQTTRAWGYHRHTKSPLFATLCKEQNASPILSATCALFAQNNRGVPKLFPSWHSRLAELIVSAPPFRSTRFHLRLATRHSFTAIQFGGTRYFFLPRIDLTPQEWNDGSVRLQQMRGSRPGRDRQALPLGTRNTEPAQSTPRGLPASQSSDGWGIGSGVGHCIEIPDRNGASAPRRARFKRGMVMKRVRTALAAVLLVALCVTAGCNDYGNTFQQNTGAFLQSLSPANIPAGGSEMTLTVIGGGFFPPKIVFMGGKNLLT